MRTSAVLGNIPALERGFLASLSSELRTAAVSVRIRGRHDRRGACGPHWSVAWRAALVLAAICVLGGLTPVANAQGDDVLPASAPLSVSARLRAQGHQVPEAEAAYLDDDERLQEACLQAYLTVQLLADAPGIGEAGRPALAQALRQLVNLDPDGGAIAPPPALRLVHAAAVRHRERLRDAAAAWLEGVDAGDPQWRARGTEAYGAAERARAEWHLALWQRYAGRALPGSR
jgi:hypothetical protein